MNRDRFLEAFRHALEAAVEVAPIADGKFDVVLWDDNTEVTILGSFDERENAERLRQAVIDAALNTGRRAAA
jgi:hypothetical protein